MFKVINDVTEEHMESYDVNYWNIITLIYTVAITIREQLVEIYSEENNEITKQKQPRWKIILSNMCHIGWLATPIKCKEGN